MTIFGEKLYKPEKNNFRESRENGLQKRDNKQSLNNLPMSKAFVFLAEGFRRD